MRVILKSAAINVRMLIVSLATLCLSMGCQGYSVTGGPGRIVAPRLTSNVGQVSDLVHVNSILIAPPVFEDKAQTAQNGEKSVFTNSVESDLVSALQAELSLELIPAKEAMPALRKSNQVLPVSASAAELLKAAKAKGCDSILETRIYEFTERVGSNVGVEKPAVVSFSMSMRRISDNKEVWSAAYNYRDQALSDNLFTLGDRVRQNDGVQWRTASEIIRQGFSEAARDLAQKRMEQFAPQTVADDKSTVKSSKKKGHTALASVE